MTYYVDTNVFIRYLVRDEGEQFKKAEQRFLKAEQGKLDLKVTDFTAVEILFVLESFYGFSKGEVVEKVQTLLVPDFIKLDKKEEFLEALILYRSHAIDLVDLFNWTIAKADKSSILSFDKDFDKLAPKLRIEP